MKRKKDLSLEELNNRLIEVKSQIAIIENNYQNLSSRANYSSVSFHYEPDMMGLNVDPNYILRDANEFASNQEGYLNSKLESLIIERDALIKQIEAKEIELESKQRI